MKKFKKIFIGLTFFFSFLSFCLSVSLWGEVKKETASDTTGQKVTQIKIGDEGIIIKTQEGKEVKEKTGEIILGKEGIKIKTPEGKETTTTEIKIEVPLKHGTTVEIDKGDVVRLGNDITIEEGEEVTGDVVAFGGDVRVKGTVSGNAVSIGGNVHVFSTGVIRSDAVSIGGRVTKDPGAVIRGESTHLSFLPIKFFGFRDHTYLVRGTNFLFTFFQVLFLFFLGIVVLALAPKNVQKTKEEIRRNIWKSGLVGFLGEVMILPVFILLLITIIGIPVALIILPLALLLGFLLGFTSVSLLVGEKLKQNTNLKPETQMMTLILGILAVEFITLFASFLTVFWGIFSPLSLILVILGIFITYLALTIGFGGAILTILGTRPKDKPVMVTPAPEQAPSTV